MALAASLLVAAHLTFVVFATLGGIVALRWPRIAWIHVPAAAWAVYVEFSGRICPVTPLENSLRLRAGLDAYSGDFVARYIFPMLYPAGLTRKVQILIAFGIGGVNIAAYLWAIQRHRRRRAQVRENREVT